MWVRVYNTETGHLCRKFKVDGLLCDQITQVRKQYELPDEPAMQSQTYVRYENMNYILEVEL